MTPQLKNILIGAVTASFIPFISFCYSKYKRWNELRKIKEMLFKEYINPLDELTNELNRTTESEYRTELRLIHKRMDYLLENEIKYMSSDNQFEIIRMIEYTKMYLFQLNEILKEYTFHDTTPVITDEIQDKQPEMKELTTKYKNTINAYKDLKRDYLVKEKDLQW